MFGISWSEFFLIILVAVLVIPARYWPDVARFLARLVKFVRAIIWKVTDATENIKQQIEIEQPIDELLKSTTDDFLDGISDVIPRKKQGLNKKNRKRTAK